MTLYVESEHCVILGCIDTFKSVKEVRLDVDNLDSSEAECFDEAFFGNLARRGVWSFEFSTYDGVEMNTKTALAFGFAAESGKDFNRSLAGINFGEENDLLAEIRKVVLNGWGPVIHISHLDTASPVYPPPAPAGYWWG